MLCFLTKLFCLDETQPWRELPGPRPLHPLCSWAAPLSAQTCPGSPTCAFSNQSSLRSEEVHVTSDALPLEHELTCHSFKEFLATR